MSEVVGIDTTQNLFGVIGEHTLRRENKLAPFIFTFIIQKEFYFLGQMLAIWSGAHEEAPTLLLISTNLGTYFYFRTFTVRNIIAGILDE